MSSRWKLVLRRAFKHSFREQNVREQSSRTSGEGVQSQALVEVAVERKTKPEENKGRRESEAKPRKPLHVFSTIFHHKTGSSLLKHK